LQFAWQFWTTWKTQGNNTYISGTFLMKTTIIGSRWFGAQVFNEIAIKRGWDTHVIGTNGEDDALVKAARSAKLTLSSGDVSFQSFNSPRKITEDMIPDHTDLIILAHCHAFVSEEARKKAKIGAFGYHPSLLPRHRGIAAVEWTIKAKDPIAGGSVYELGKGWDDGLILAQDWCFVYPDDDAGSLWKRSLAPMGINLITKVFLDTVALGHLPLGKTQDERAVTLAPKLESN
jgi:methionyl-tRNA formyltransferase